jgi:hypothetical protein
MPVYYPKIGRVSSAGPCSFYAAGGAIFEILAREGGEVQITPSEELFTKYLWEVWDALEQCAVSESYDPLPKPVYFRFLTLMSFLCAQLTRQLRCKWKTSHLFLEGQDSVWAWKGDGRKKNVRCGH